ncbi:MAG: hypothetical protein IAE95_14470 [Chitinophagaceae bacterium]|nr:hypothetical protein [Chitinophagaceae bacterium]
MENVKKGKAHSNRELAMAYVFPADRDKAAEEDFWAKRREQLTKQPRGESIFSNIMQLKFRMEDYLRSEHYDSALSFGYFLKAYIFGLGKKNIDFAGEIGIQPAELSQLIHNHRNPKQEILVRLEIHSNNNIPAIMWYRLLEKHKAHQLMSDVALRKSERKHVKKHLEFSF